MLFIKKPGFGSVGIDFKSWIRILIRIDFESWIRIRIETNTDPKHWFSVLVWASLAKPTLISEMEKL